MIMYLTFGDYYDDGHGKFKIVFVEGEDPKAVEYAEQQLRKCYPNLYLAEDYEDGSFSNDTWKAIDENGYPIWRFTRIDESHNWEGVTDWDEIKKENGYYDINVIIDIYIWLLNAFGAGIKQIEIPHALNTDVGYGWFS